MVIPNEGRIIVELIKTGEKDGEIYLPTRENMKAGENLLIGRVVHPGEPTVYTTGDPGDKKSYTTKFEVGQLVMFQEYSMSGFYKDVKALAEGQVKLTETMKPENQYHVVAMADVMCYDA